MVAADAPHPGCNCGRRAVTCRAPLLTDDLVIAARDRAREPELPRGDRSARAVDADLAPFGPLRRDHRARDRSDDERERAHRRRVRAARASRLPSRRAPDQPATGGAHAHRAHDRPRLAGPPGRLSTLAALRQSEAIEAAVLCSPSARRRNSRRGCDVVGDGASWLPLMRRSR